MVSVVLTSEFSEFFVLLLYFGITVIFQQGLLLLQHEESFLR